MGLETGVFDGKSRRGAVLLAGIIDLQDRTHSISILFNLSFGRRVRTQQFCLVLP